MQQRWWTADDAVARGPAWVAVDVGVALLSAWIAVGESDSTASVASGPLLVRLAALLWFLAIALRRFGPATCLWVAGGATVLAAAAGQPLTNLSLATALTLALVVRTRPAVPATVLAAVPVAAALAALLTDPEGRSTWVLAAVVHAAAVVWGTSSRRAARARVRFEELSRESALRADRDRLALDLHDAVGHAVTRMLTCAGAARLSLPPGESPARAALDLVEQAGRSAMEDLDRVLGLLRTEDGSSAPLEQRLAALVRAPELQASLDVGGGGTDPLPLDLQDAVYRIVQESLTNVLRHSSDRRVRVVVDQTPDQVRVTVTDSGPPATAVPLPRAPGGRGLVGMDARVTALGGTLTAGPDGSGWQVEARLPVSPTGTP